MKTTKQELRVKLKKCVCELDSSKVRLCGYMITSFFFTAPSQISGNFHAQYVEVDTKFNGENKRRNIEVCGMIALHVASYSTQ